MAGPDNERTFVPAELDVLEDALELPDGVAWRVPADLGDDARARIHGALVRYRAIERHAQALLREHDPPAAVLAAVMAEARAAAAAPPSVPATSERPRGRWFRALWILPSFAALAGAAVVAVMVMRPSADAPTMAESAKVARADAPPPPMSAKAASEPMPAIADASIEQQDARWAGRGDGVVATAAADAPATPDVVARSAPREESRRKADAGEDELGLGRVSRDPESPKKKAGAAPGSAPAPEPKAPPKPSTKNVQTADDLQPAGPAPVDRLARAEDARRRGDCNAARPDYESVIKTDTAKRRARARAGLALCLERLGEAEAARKLVDQARLDDAAIDAWISSER